MEGSGLAHSLDPGKSQSYLMLEARLEQHRIGLPVQEPVQAGNSLHTSQQSATITRLPW